jgi:hypothetical protein
MQNWRDYITGSFVKQLVGEIGYSKQICIVVALPIELLRKPEPDISLSARIGRFGAKRQVLCCI